MVALNLREFEFIRENGKNIFYVAHIQSKTQPFWVVFCFGYIEEGSRSRVPGGQKRSGGAFLAAGFCGTGETCAAWNASTVFAATLCRFLIHLT